MTIALSDALELADAGLPCFPCLRDKRPSCPNGYLDGTTDKNMVRALWQQFPGPLIGVPTGKVSGFDVLDVDAPKHRQAAAWWEQNRDRMPATRLHRTGSGGLHLLFRHLPEMRCWTGRPVVGIDGRGNGGYMIWWPAAGEPVISDPGLASWPAWLLTALAPRHEAATARRATRFLNASAEQRLRGLVRFVANAREGERNNCLYWAACRAAETPELNAPWAAAVLAEAATRAGLPHDEAERTAWSGLGARHA